MRRRSAAMAMTFAASQLVVAPMALEGAMQDRTASATRYLILLLSGVTAGQLVDAAIPHLALEHHVLQGV